MSHDLILSSFNCCQIKSPQTYSCQLRSCQHRIDWFQQVLIHVEKPTLTDRPTLTAEKPTLIYVDKPTLIYVKEKKKTKKKKKKTTPAHAEKPTRTILRTRVGRSRINRPRIDNSSTQI
jgi:hypothetical protein